MKKFMSLTVATMLCLTMMGCGSSTSSDTSADETTAYETATEVSTDTASSFEKLLENPDTVLTYDGEDHNVSDFSYYAYTDINQDGTDEMILSTTSDSFLAQDESAIVLANVDNEIVPILYVKSEAGAELRSDEADAVLTSYSRFSGEAHAIIYELKDGELNQIKTLDFWEANHKDDSGNPAYQIDGKDVSKEDYSSAWAQYYENATEITYTSIHS